MARRDTENMMDSFWKWLMHADGRRVFICAMLALTSVSVVGPESEFATSFLALNPLHILATQEILQAGVSMDEEQAVTGAEAC